LHWVLDWWLRVPQLLCRSRRISSSPLTVRVLWQDLAV
jgi:hypothetical protein